MLLCPAGRGADCCDEFVSLFVCLPARISQRPHAQTTRSSAYVTYGRGLVLLCRRCDTICTSGFAADFECCAVRCVADNEMLTSFSNPNYGLDALNSNCLLPSPSHTSHSDVIVDNMTSLAGNRCYATDNHLPFDQVMASFPT